MTACHPVCSDLNARRPLILTLDETNETDPVASRFTHGIPFHRILDIPKKCK